MSKIIINDLNFHYAEYFNPVFQKVNLTLDTNWRLGLIGRNGRGKTTFLKLLQGELQPDRGTVITPVKMEYYPYEYHTGYVKTLDVIKEVIGQLKSREDQMEELLLDPTPERLDAYGRIQEDYQAAGGYEMEARIRKEMYLMGLSEVLLERDFTVLSGGERSKLLLIALFLRNNTFVLMDEPTNHLDIRGKQAVADYLKQKSGFLAVSHDRQFLDEITDHILAINKTDITLEKGNYSSWKENVSRQEAFELRTRTHLEKEIATLERGALTRRDWAALAEKEKNPYKSNNRGNGSRAAKFMRQAKRAEQDFRDDIARKKELLKNYETVPELGFLVPGRPETAKDGELLAALDHFTFAYDREPVFRDFSFRISEGERIWVRGGNGCGKSTLLKVLSGQLPTPCFKLRDGIYVSVFGQEPLWQSGYAGEYITDQGRWAKFLEICECLDLTAGLLKRPIETYSSGEMGKLDVARALSEESQILLLDEPLNYMDVYFREQLEEAILTIRPTLVFVEHDERFGSRVATRSIDLDQISGQVQKERNPHGEK